MWNGKRPARPLRARRAFRLTAVVLPTAAGALTCLTAAAAGAVGDLTFRNCIAGESESTAAGSGACAPFAATASQGNNTGIDNPESVAVSPDGRSLYVAAGDDDSVVRFDRNRATGALTFAFCFTGETESGGECQTLPKASSGGGDSGLDDPESVTVSPDGKSVYLTSRGDDSVVRFNRVRATGFISYAGCITGEVASGPLGSGACRAIPSAQVNGHNSGLDDPKSKQVAITADGKSLYATSEADSSVVRFKRNASTGALTYRNCITGERETGPAPAGTGACAAIPSATSGGSNSGLGQPRWATLGPEDRSLYLALDVDDAVARFKRNASTGALRYRGCITGDTNAASCTAIPGATPGGNQSGLNFARAVEVSADGRSLYLMGAVDSAVSRFRRNPATGSISYARCLSADTDLAPQCSLTPGATGSGDHTGLSQMRSLQLSPDDRTLYTSAQGDSSVAYFRRNLGSGALAFQGCVTGDTDATPCATVPKAVQFGNESGLSGPETAVVSRNGRSVYASSNDDDGVARFSRVRDIDAPNTKLTKKPKRRTTNRRAELKFKSDEPESSFRCKLDHRRWKPCESPFETGRLRRTRHTFKVRATDSAGNVDPSPAARSWRVVRPGD